MNTERFREFSGLLKTTAADWMEDGALRLSAALAYYSIFSIAPLLVLAVGLGGWFFGADALRGHLDEQLSQYVGRQAAEGVQTMVRSTSQPAQSLTAMLVGLGTLLLGASGVFGQLKDALNTIWEVRPKPGLGWRSFVRERLLSFGMVLVIGFLLLVSFVLTTLLSALDHLVESMIGLPDWLWGGAALLVSLAVVTLLIAAIFKVLPDVEIEWRQVWTGALATAVLFEIGKFFLAFYLGRESTASGFGAAGSVVLLLLWVYYASCILLFGAEFTKVYAEARGRRLQPTPLAEPVTAEARAQQGLAPAPPTPEPPRESLPEIFPPDPVPAVPRFPLHLSEVPAFVKARPVASLAAAAGGGAAIGLVSRVIDGHRDADDFTSSRARPAVLGAAALILLGRFGGALAQRSARFIGKTARETTVNLLRRI